MSTLFDHGHALLIGVGGDLPGTVHDALGLEQVLTDPTRCAYPTGQVNALTGAAATRAAILAALEKLAQTTTATSTVIVYFSGHGYQVPTPIGQFYYLMPYGYDLQKLTETALSGAELVGALKAIPAQKLLVVLDCCHAGGLTGPLADLAKSLGSALKAAPLPPEAPTLLAQGRGRVLLASSQANEYSLAGKPYSAFTLAVLDALCGLGASQMDGYVRVADVALYAREKVPGRTKNQQHPILHFEQADNFRLAYYAGGDATPKAPPYTAPDIEIEPTPGAWRGVNQAQQVVHGPQTNITGQVTGPVMSGNFQGPVNVGNVTTGAISGTGITVGHTVQQTTHITNVTPADAQPLALVLAAVQPRLQALPARDRTETEETFTRLQAELREPQPDPRRLNRMLSTLDELLPGLRAQLENALGRGAAGGTIINHSGSGGTVLGNGNAAGAGGVAVGGQVRGGVHLNKRTED